MTTISAGPGHLAEPGHLGASFRTGPLAGGVPGAPDRSFRLPLSLEPDLQTPMGETREILGNLQHMLEILRERKLENSPEYQRLLAMARELSVRLRDAWAHADSTTRSWFTSRYSLEVELEVAPLIPIRSTLGQLGRPGVVSSGQEVETLQVLLNRQGIYTPKTGVFDIMTATSVSEFQKRHGLAVTGTVGVEVRQILNGLIPPS